MSIALERVTCFPVYGSPALAKVPTAGDDVASCSSSIGRNSDCDGGSDDEAEVQSSYKGPLDTMDALEDSLPFRRGISKFYCGKSKSFTSLGDALPSSSAKDLAKPENYSRKRKNLLGFNIWGKPSRNSQRSNGDIAVSKRPANSSRITQGLGPSRSSSSGSSCYSNGSRESQQLPPVYSHDKAIAQISSFAPTKWLSCTTRSFSLADLESAVSPSPSIKSGDKQRRFH